MTIPILQGTLDLMILRTLSTMGPQHAYAIANRIQLVSGGSLEPEPGHHLSGSRPDRAARLVPWLLGQDRKQSRSEVLHHHQGRVEGLNEETERWRQMAGVVEKLLAEEQ